MEKQTIVKKPTYRDVSSGAGKPRANNNRVDISIIFAQLVNDLTRSEITKIMQVNDTN